MTDPAQNPPEDLLDMEQLQMLMEAGADESVEMFREILSLYEEESRQKLDDLETARTRGDYESFGRAVHALAGSSANIGGRRVWLTAKDLENLCKEGQGPKAAESLDSLKQLHSMTLARLQEYADQFGSKEE
jgi:HPt (histidine-containing phosphotransfer) domain-containing protein